MQRFIINDMISISFRNNLFKEISQTGAKVMIGKITAVVGNTSIALSIVRISDKECVQFVIRILFRSFQISAD